MAHEVCRMSFCSIPQNLIESANTRCRWPKGHIVTWTIASGLPQFTDEEYLEICKMSWQPWEAESGLRTKYVKNNNANCIFTTRRIDGQHGVLAEAELPCGNVTASTTLRLWMDTGDNWANATNPPGRTIDVLRVMIHEIGHLLGIGHIAGGTPAIMNPSISDIRTILEPDIKEVRDRYGDPSVTPSDPEDPACCLLSTVIEDYIRSVCGKR